MKKTLSLIPFLAGLLLMACAQAGGSSEAVPEGWTTDYEAALKQAKAENKSVLIDFTGSDWCGWCIRLDKEILSKDEFKDFAKENLVLVYIDFPRSKPQSDELKEQNAKLAKKYGVRGYPTLVILDSEGKQIGQTGYQRGGPNPFIANLKKMIDKG